MRVKFNRGEQRKFLELVIKKTDAPSLRGLLQFGFKIPYSTLKNYYNESRLLPKNLFIDFCNLAEIDTKSFKVEYLVEEWGKVKGGKLSREVSFKK